MDLEEINRKYVILNKKKMTKDIYIYIYIYNIYDKRIVLRCFHESETQKGCFVYKTR